MTDEKLRRISELTKIARERELTVEEQTEREELRSEYKEAMKSSLKSTLEQIKIVD